jgi:hypothetical protein
MIYIPPRDVTVLLDNLPRRENRVKIEFLGRIAARGSILYLQCAEYRGGSELGFSQENITLFLEKINEKIILDPPEDDE